VKILAGLGNPGNQYKDTRHNTGFRFLDLLTDKQGLGFTASPRFHAETATWESDAGKVLLIKPRTFMNNCGEAVGPLARFYKVETGNIFVVHDDLDLPPGKVRIKTGGGHGGHNGLKSLNRYLPDTGYLHIKIGIGRPEHGEAISWVLGKPGGNERLLERQAFEALLPELVTILDGDTAKASHRIRLNLNPEV